MRVDEYENYGSTYENDIGTDYKEKKRGIPPSNPNGFRGALKALLIVLLLPALLLLIFVSMNLTLNLFLKNFTTFNQQLDEAVIAEYKKENLDEYIIVHKSFGAVGRNGRRANYFSLQLGSEELEVKVPIELYRSHKEGDTLKLWNNPKSEYVLSDNDELIKKFQ